MQIACNRIAHSHLLELIFLPKLCTATVTRQILLTLATVLLLDVTAELGFCAKLHAAREAFENLTRNGSNSAMAPLECVDN